MRHIEWSYKFVLFQSFLSVKLSWAVFALIDRKVKLILVVFGILLQTRLGFKQFTLNRPHFLIFILCNKRIRLV